MKFIRSPRKNGNLILDGNTSVNINSVNKVSLNSSNIIIGKTIVTISGTSPDSAYFYNGTYELLILSNDNEPYLKSTTALYNGNIVYFGRFKTATSGSDNQWAFCTGTIDETQPYTNQTGLACGYYSNNSTTGSIDFNILLNTGIEGIASDNNWNVEFTDIAYKSNLISNPEIQDVSIFNVSHQNNSRVLTANNSRRGKYTIKIHLAVANNGTSNIFTVQNNKCKPDAIVIMTCTSNHKIEVHTFNVSSDGWRLFYINKTGSVLNSFSDDLEFNFVIM